MNDAKDNAERNDSFIHFACRFCGHKSRVAKVHAGKKSKCPKCQNALIIPQLPVALAQEPEAVTLKRDPEPASFQQRRAETPTESELRLQPPDLRDTAYTDPRAIEVFRDSFSTRPDDQPPARRKLPWIIDVFLYPANKPGLITLAIIIFIPMALNLFAGLVGPFGFIVLILAFPVNVVIAIYGYWYTAECIRDSAMGGLRAPETFSETPGFAELFSRLLLIFGCLAVCIAPAGFYFGYTRANDLPLRIILGCGLFIYPMMLLAILMFDSASAMNPLLILASVFSTFFQYCALVAVYFGASYCIVRVMALIRTSSVLSVLADIASLYLMMVAAHLLGRFYYKYQDKLNWEV